MGGAESTAGIIPAGPRRDRAPRRARFAPAHGVGVGSALVKSWSGRSGGGPTAWAVVAVFVAGALVRLALLRYPRLWYDEATVGIMGLIVLRGEWPIYFTGQPFMGALD